MKPRKRILIDMDNTVCDLYAAWLGAYNREFGQNITKADVTTWDIHNHIPHGGLIYKYLETPHFYRTFNPIPGAVEAVEKLQRVVDIRICSAHHADDGVASDKMWWLRNHMPFIPRKDVMLAYHKHEILADGLVDDGPHNIVKYAATHPNAKVWALRWPYNKHLESTATMFTADYLSAERFWQDLVLDVYEWAGHSA